MTNTKIAALAERLTKLADDYNADRARLLEEAKNADIEPAALRRLVAWMRKDELACLEQQAVDDQYRFLAGLRPAPADLPTEGELAKAAALYADELTVRDVAKKMGISVGKAHCLKMKAAAFKVQPNVNMNTAPETSLGAVAPYSSNEDGKIEEPQRPPADDLPFPEMPVHLRRPLPVAHRKPR